MRNVYYVSIGNNILHHYQYSKIMIEIMQANISHKSVVIDLLNEFKKDCYIVYAIDTEIIYDENTLKDLHTFYDQNITSGNVGIFLAKKEEQYIGIIIWNVSYQFRNGRIFVEIEDFFVRKQDRWGDVAKKLMDTVFNWAKEKWAKEVRLESGLLLERAHKFYENYWFMYCSKAYSKKF